MKQRLSIFAILLSLLCTACKEKEFQMIPDPNFVQLNGHSFQLQGDEYYPVMLNYVPSYQTDADGSFVVAPHIDYDSVGYIEATGKEAVSEQLTGHFSLIKEMGFNTVRICFNRLGQDEKGHAYYQTEEGQRFYISKKSDREAILKGVSEFIQIIHKEGLHVMLLIREPIGSTELENFTISLLERFREEPTIFAYDFMNEPLYFDEEEMRKKEEAFSIVEHWRQLVRRHAPKQLFTIGFSEPIEVFEWDASILPVDFVEIHTYHPLRVPSEIFWYSHYIGKPWMIGETGLPADNDSISYIEQAQFLTDAYKLVRDAGGCGFGWWEFQEIPGTHFEAGHTGLLNHEGTTTTADGRHTIQGSVKPAGRCLPSLQNYRPRKMERPVNYYNMLGYSNIAIQGRIINASTKLPIEGAVIRGWNEDWSVGMNTYSAPDGTFTLFCNDECVHFEISAPGMSKAKFDKAMTFRSPNGTPYDRNRLPNRTLEYHKISYQPFLRTEETPHKTYATFDFEPAKFSQNTWEANLGEVKLTPIRTKKPLNHIEQ